MSTEPTKVEASATCNASLPGLTAKGSAVPISDALTDHLRACLHRQAECLPNTVPESVQADAHDWIADRRIENLAEWLRAEGSVAQADRDEVLRRLTNAAVAGDDDIHPDAVVTAVIWMNEAKHVTDALLQFLPEPFHRSQSSYLTLTGEEAESKSLGGWDALVATLSCAHTPFARLSLKRYGLPFSFPQGLEGVDRHGRYSIHQHIPMRKVGPRDTDWVELELKAPAKQWDDSCDWILRLAGLYLKHYADKRTEVRNSQPLVVQAVRETGFSRMMNASSAISWAIGEGVAMPDPNYAVVPEAAQREVVGRMLSRSYSLLTDAPETLRQRMLPIGSADTASNGPLAVELATRSVLSVYAAKVALVVLSNFATHNKRFSTSIGDLAKLIYPNNDRIRKEHYVSTADGLIELAHLRAEFEDGRWFRLFDLVVPPLHLSKADAKTFRSIVADPFGIGPTSTFLDKAQPNWFLMNLRGALALPNRQPQLLRHYVRAAYLWNQAFLDRDGGFDAGRVRDWETLAWAAEVNALPTRVVEYQAASPAQRRKLKDRLAPEASKAKGDVRRDLEQLHDVGLLRVEKVGRKGDSFRLLPPTDYVQLRQELREGSQRSTGRKAGKKKAATNK